MRLRPIRQMFHWERVAQRVTKPLFIIGSTRSGKTLLKRLLAQHPQLTAYPGEANWLWHPQTHLWLYSPHRDTVPPYWAGPAFHTEKSLEYRHRWHGDHIRTVFGWHLRKEPASGTLLNESAKIMFMVPYILSLFPDARFVHLVRNGRYVAFTQATKILGEINSSRWVYAQHGFALSFHSLLRRCAKSWAAHVQEAEEIEAGRRRLSPGKLLTLQYEELCRRPIAEIARVFEFLGMDSVGPSFSLSEDVSNRNPLVGREIDDKSRAVLDEELGSTLQKAGYG